MANRNIPDSRRTARLTRVVLVVFGLYALLLNLALLGLSRYTIGQQETTRQDFLEVMATNVVDPPRTYFDFLEFLWDEYTGHVSEPAIEAYRPSLDWETLESALHGARRGPVLTAALLTPRGEILLQSPPDQPVMPPGEEEINAILQAYNGETIFLVDDSDIPRERLYVPVVGTLSREPVAVLCLVSQVVDPAILRRSRIQFLFGVILTTTIVLVLWVATMRLVRRTLEAEREAGRADRLRALGTLTAGISHEIRNPLGIISLQAEELRALAKEIPGEKHRADLESLADDIRSETRRLRDLLEDFLRFTRFGAEETTNAGAIHPAEVLDNLVRIWSRGFDENHRRIVYHNRADDATTLFPEARLRQVVINLLRNADEALGNRPGTIEVKLEKRGGEVCLSVSDDGPGIPPEEIRRIFDPFHTTRPEGTGLGLALAKTHVENAGGTLEATSTPGKGATFTMTLPLAPQDAPPASSPSR